MDSEGGVPREPRPARDGASLTWLGFLLVGFATVGLMGLFAVFAAPLPLQREIAREATLDAALAAARGPDAAAALDALRPELAESAAAILPADAAFAERVAAERVAARSRFAHEAAVVAFRLRLLVCVVTAMAAAFGAACYFAGRRGGT